MTEDKYFKTDVEEKEVPYDPSQLRKISKHPCFSEKACNRFGRIHLPVAPKCNIQCNYCLRKYDCVNESRPGVTSKVLSPEEALERVDEAMDKFHYIKVIGVAGPGEPLFNEETFKTYELVSEKYPEKIYCISTNGLLLSEKLEELKKLGVSTITVTVNAIDPEIAKDVYSHIYYQGKKYTGKKAAEILLEKQLEGIEKAIELGMILKVNTVYIPGVNEDHIPEVAKKIGDIGVYLHNIIPLIPQYKFSEKEPPTPEEKEEMKEKCSDYVRQMEHCRQCRSDACGKLGEDKQDSLES
ncbi:MAG: Radical SAM superfamily enzyme [Candidatus Methanohalarchaeum thermophilum]|uniref:FeMo cofactor biosynthesis protein NifB n=1 Tax=Methanohalarchaeum thermophilum TaxID=1903181 RepID=A0A1Q6DVQ9_METT1|nr:MAG: Radical SAM superfamily enzyme [Candidatus Methanohalarchaeum thermophilum]